MSYSLDSLANGALLEKFNAAMSKVTENIADPNTKAKAKRKIIMEIICSPDKDRDFIPMEIAVKTVLAPSENIASRIVIGRDKNGKAISNEYNGNKNQIHMEVAENGDVSLQSVAEAVEESANEQDKPKLTVVGQK